MAFENPPNEPRQNLQTLLPLTEASNLLGRFYYDENVYREELGRIFYRSWLCVGRNEDIAEPGSFVVRDIGEESIIIVRTEGQELRAFYNVCRHRGSRLATEPKGNMSAIQCPYHSWTYSLEGKLIGAPHTESLKGFDKNEYSLFPVRAETWAGFVFINFDPRATPLKEHLKGLVEKCARLPLETLKGGGKIEYEVAANWKVICENYSECYHCPTIHPEFNRITYYRNSHNYAFLTNGVTKDAFSGGWMELSEGCDSMTWTGKTNRPPIKGTTNDDKRRIYYFLVFPTMFFSLHPDYLMVHRVSPQDPTHSKVVCEWYFEPEPMGKPDFDPTDAIKIWDLVNRQDWHVCELTQKGVSSRAYTPGRYTGLESTVHDFDAHILQIMGTK